MQSFISMVFNKMNLFFMKTALSGILLFCSLQCDANQHLISLGPNCAPALCLNYYQIRKEAYPFDWNICYFNSMYKLLETDFENYLLPENLVLDPSAPWFVIDSYTNVQYNHDFPIETVDAKVYENEWEDIGALGNIVPNFLELYPGVYAKYQRRINRLRQVLHSEDSVLFFIINIYKSQGIMLRDFFERTYPNLDFKILVINVGERSKGEWNEPKIYDYTIPDLGWDLSAPGYHYVMQDMGLIP